MELRLFFSAEELQNQLCRQTLPFAPRQLLMLDNNETGLYDLELQIADCEFSNPQSALEV